MILGVGLDVVELERIAQALESFGDRFLARVLTDAERAALPVKPVPYLAARFAAKEAASKALGTGFSMGVGPHSFEVLGGERRKPEMYVRGEALRLMQEMGATRCHVSLTHGRDVAAAVVILEA